MDVRFFDRTNKRKRRDLIDEDFEAQMSSASAIFSYFLSKNLVTNKAKQINVFCDAEIESFNLQNTVIDQIWDVEVPFNPNEMLAIENMKDKITAIRNLLGKIFIPIFSAEKWDSEILERALESASNVDFRYERLLPGTPKKSPDKKHTVIVKCVEDIFNFKMICYVYDRKGMLCLKKQLIETWPSVFVYNRFLGKLSWLNNSEFEIKSKTSQWKSIVKI